MTNHKTPGRKPLSSGDPTVQIAFKAPSSTRIALENKVKELQALGYEKTNISDLARTLVEYSVEAAHDIYTEIKPQAAGAIGEADTDGDSRMA